MAQEYSYLKLLECSGCGKPYDPNQIQRYCAECQSPIMALYDLESVRINVDRDALHCRKPGMWRWHELLPVSDPEDVVTMGEGDTPLLDLPRLSRESGLQHVYLKDEGQNPTGSFKARGISAALSKAKELGIKKVIIPTAGNAGGAMAAYASRAGLESHVCMPRDTPKANIQECLITGSGVTLIDGLINDAARLADEKARSEGWFDVSTFKEPYRVEGKKVMGYEIAEAFDWEVPDVIIYPTGGGTGLVAIWKAFHELQVLGWLKGKITTRIVAVQAEGCAPVVKAFNSGALYCDFWARAQTLASGLRVPKSFADKLILLTLRESNGTAISVSDREIIQAQRQLGVTEGVFAAPEGAATLAGLYKLAAAGWVHPEETIVLLNTGTGLKYIEQMVTYDVVEKGA
jgi:threonine synthase